VRASLTIREPGASARSLAVGDDPVVIGRDAGCDIVLADPRVSRQHARVASRSGFLVLSDLGSTNGTYVRDERIAEIALGPGDVVTLGDTTIEVGRPPSTPPSDPAPLPSAEG
jgi:pSer/pThr/pTyr-binding forkhead associated (FHA) protein